MTGPAVLVALLLTIALLPVVTRLAHRIGAVASPRSDRWNRRAVPILGGLAIAAGVIGGSLLIEMPIIDRLALLVGVGAMVMLGFADDIGSVPPTLRIIIEAGVGAAFTASVRPSRSPPRLSRWP